MSGWDTEPGTSELRAPRADDELPPAHRRRRPTKRWCRGKHGVEHKLEIRLQRSIASMRNHLHKYGRDNYRAQGYKQCRWSWWAWRFYGDWYYSCGHERYCVNCGKIFPLAREDCPEYTEHPKPTISPQQAEAEAWAARGR